MIVMIEVAAADPDEVEARQQLFRQCAALERAHPNWTRTHAKPRRDILPKEDESHHHIFIQQYAVPILGG